jgi:hypothetical protein
MNTATLRPRIPDRSRLRFRWWWVPLLLLVVAIVVAVPRLFASPAVVSRVSFVNNTNYAMDVQVTDAARNGWTDLATAERRRTTVVRDVVDQGKTWIFHVESQGFDGGELQFTKDELKRADWKIVIPDSVGTKLAAEGAPPAPAPNF